MTSFQYVNKVNSLLLVGGWVFFWILGPNVFFGEIIVRWMGIHGKPFTSAWSFLGDTENTEIEINTPYLTVV